MDAEPRGTLRDFLYMFFRHKGKITVVFLAIVLGVTIVSVMTTPTYRASAKILVKLGRENLYTPATSQSPVSQPTAEFSGEERVNSEIEIIRARGLVEKVIGTIGVKALYPNIDAPSLLSRLKFWSPPITPMQRATLQFEKALRVEGVKKSNIIRIDFDHGKPDVAARTLSLLIDAYLERHVAAYKQPQDHDFFDKQTKTIEEALRRSEAELQAFRNRHDISALNEQKAVLLKQISDLELNLARTRAEINENKGKKVSMEARVSGASGRDKFGKETETNTYVISNIRNKIADLKLRERALASKYPEQNYLVITIRKEIEKGEQLLAAEEKTYHDKEVRSIDDTLAALAQKEGSQARHLAAYKAEIYRINSLQNQLADLERQARIDEENYSLYVKKAEEARISDAMDERKIANISIVQPPLVPIRPVKPDVKLNMLLAVILGACGGLGLAYSLDSLGHSFRTTEDVKKHLGLPVLASLPKLKP